MELAWLLSLDQRGTVRSAYRNGGRCQRYFAETQLASLLPIKGASLNTPLHSAALGQMAVRQTDSTRSLFQFVLHHIGASEQNCSLRQ